MTMEMKGPASSDEILQWEQDTIEREANDRQNNRGRPEEKDINATNANHRNSAKSITWGKVWNWRETRIRGEIECKGTLVRTPIGNGWGKEWYIIMHTSGILLCIITDTLMYSRPAPIQM
jgi:hypothetical protein